MTVYAFDPTCDPRWPEFIDRHPDSSIFHSVGWLQSIQETYGYKPVVYTTSPPSVLLTNGIVLCEIKSWLTGRRLVSLPFSDHCQPLVEDTRALPLIAQQLRSEVEEGKWKYVEIRPIRELPPLEGAFKAPESVLHKLDLRPDTSELLKNTHKSCIQRPIKRADNEGIAYECGNSERLLAAFYRLMIQTRRRHQLPPQPIQWFRNLIACMGEHLKIHAAFKDGREIASILTLQFKDAIVYKYGCSDSRFHNLGGMPLLFWKVIVGAKLAGLTCMDFGRSDADNPGLITFKDRWGAMASPLVYLNWTRKQASVTTRGNSSELLKRLFSIMPDSLLETTGRILYRHIG